MQKVNKRQSKQIGDEIQIKDEHPTWQKLREKRALQMQIRNFVCAQDCKIEVSPFLERILLYGEYCRITVMSGEIAASFLF